MKKTLKLFSIMVISLLVGILFVNADETLQSKIDAASGKTTIQLDADYTENIVIGTGKDITIDLNGKTITGKISVNGGSLTIDDNATGGKVNLGNNNIPVESGILTINNGAIESTGNYGIYGLQGSTITINGGSIRTYDYACVGSNNTTGNATFVINGGTLTAKWNTVYLANPIGLTVNGGTLNGGIAARMGIININGGTINASTYGDFVYMNNYYWKSGYAETPDAIYAMAGSYATTSEEGNDLKINIKGGNINVANNEGSAVAVYDLGKVAQNVEVNISGNPVLKTNSVAVVDTVAVLGFSDFGVDSPKTGYNNPDYTGKVKVNISGGKFSNVNYEHLVNGYTAYTYGEQDEWEVLPTIAYQLEEDALFVELGKSIKFIPDIDALYEMYYSISTDDEAIATYKDGDLTGVKVGDTVLFVDFGGMGTSVPVYVYQVNPADKADTAAAELAKELIESVLNGAGVKGISPEVATKIVNAVVAGKTISTDLKVSEIKKEDLPKDTVEKIEKAIADNNGVIAGFLDISILLNAGNDALGNVNELPEELEISVDLDKKYTEVPEGYDRTYFVVRLHNGETSIVEATYKDGKLYFESDRFSTYTIAYKDTEVTTTKNPQTGDSIGLYIAMSLMSFTGMAITYKKRHA